MNMDALASRFMELLPGLLQQLGRWLYDWQVLIAGILALVAAHIWGRSVLRAAELRASGPARANRPAPPRRTTSTAGPVARDLRTADPNNRPPARPEALARLRATIR